MKQYIVFVLFVLSLSTPAIACVNDGMEKAGWKVCQESKCIQDNQGKRGGGKK